MLNKLHLIAEEKKIDTIIISAPDNIEYFTGVDSLGDAQGLLIYSRVEGKVELYVPLLEYYRYRDALPGDIQVYGISKTIQPSDAVVVSIDWKDIVSKYTTGTVGADLSHPGPLQSIIRQALGDRGVDISMDIWKHRMIKSEKEIEAIREAVKITVKGIKAIQASLRNGVTESELTGIFEKTVRDNGVSRLAFDPIIAFKPNNAYPHTTPGVNKLKEKDIVLVDVGVKVNGRCSDITRLILHGRPSKEEKRNIEAIVEALWEAIDTVTPGVKAEDVHNAAVKVLEKYGLKERFIHGLGHGVGVVVHEPPYLRVKSETVLEPGMVFTIEPGVYFPGKYGVRVEDVVVVTKKGARVLSRRLDHVMAEI